SSTPRKYARPNDIADAPAKLLGSRRPPRAATGIGTPGGGINAPSCKPPPYAVRMIVASVRHSARVRPGVIWNLPGPPPRVPGGGVPESHSRIEASSNSVFAACLFATLFPTVACSGGVIGAVD